MAIEQMNSQFTVLAFGFLAVDLVILDEEETTTPCLGGSAGNVCRNLNVLGHPCLPAGKIGDDEFGNIITNEFNKLNISIQFLSKDRLLSTPFCIESLSLNQLGHQGHSFRTKLLHPIIESPRFSSPNNDDLNEIFHNIDQKLLIYTNKQIRGLSDIIKRQGFYLYYEPDCIDDWETHHALCRSADIIKFNHQQFMEYSTNPFSSSGDGCIIETFGGDGLVLWPTITEDPIALQTVGGPKILDSCGAGDWLSAKLIASFMESEPKSISINQVKEAMKVARISCSYIGSSGLHSLKQINNALANSDAPSIEKWKYDPAEPFISRYYNSL